MYVAIDSDAVPPRTRLVEPEDFSRFHAEVNGPRGPALDRTLRDSGVGRLDGDHVWVRRAWLESQGVESEKWREGLDAMWTFAMSKGWVTSDGAEVRAHVVTP